MNPVWHFVNGVPQVGPLTIGTAAVRSTVPIIAADYVANVSKASSGYTNSALSMGWNSAPYGWVQVRDAAANGPLIINEAGGSMALGVSAGGTFTNSFTIADAYKIAWATRSALTSASDGQLAIKNTGATASIAFDTGAAANGQVLGLVNTLTELTTIAAAASTDTTIQMPANSVVLAVSVRVTTVIPTATSFSVGDSGSATRFSTANVGVAQGSTDPGTKAGAYYNASALSVRLTMNGGTPAANTGRVRVTIYYYSVTPPTS